jgi:hypothetical protein
MNVFKFIFKRFTEGFFGAIYALIMTPWVAEAIAMGLVLYMMRG